MLQGLSLVSMIIAWFFLLTPNWPEAVWMLLSGALIIVMSSDPRFRYVLIVLVMFNTACYLGVNSSFWFNSNIFAGSESLVDGLLDPNFPSQEASCVSYFGWSNAPDSDPNRPTGTGQCRNIEYKAWVIFTQILQVVVIYPTMTVLSFLVLGSYTPPEKPDPKRPDTETPTIN